MKILAVLALVIIILIFVVIPSFKPKQTPNLAANSSNQASQICQKINQDSSVCERIGSTETKDDCYRDYSRLSKDQAFCDRISNSNQKDQCLLNIALNISNR